MNYKSKCKVKSKNVLASRFFALPADGTEHQANGDRKMSAMGRNGCWTNSLDVVLRGTKGAERKGENVLLLRS